MTDVVMQTKVTANTNKPMDARRKQHTQELIDSHTWQTNTQTQNKHTPPFFLKPQTLRFQETCSQLQSGGTKQNNVFDQDLERSFVYTPV